jgi:nucleotide sugar dehydrogenase
MKIGIIGLGFVGSAIHDFLMSHKIDTTVYDKYKDGGIGDLDHCLQTDILFLALPTLYDIENKQYDTSAIVETLDYLQKHEYNGIILNKSTIEPTSTDTWDKKYNLSLVHNPEFLTARTASKDFANQNHIVLGFGKHCSLDQKNRVSSWYKECFPKAQISMCLSNESEMMKITANSFYATKIQFFNEIYLLCEKLHINYNQCIELILKNNWVNPMHTTVPGPDGKLSYSGACFPKDTNALLSLMQRTDTPHKQLESTVLERNEMRKD